MDGPGQPLNTAKLLRENDRNVVIDGCSGFEFEHRRVLAGEQLQHSEQITVLRLEAQL